MELGPLQDEMPQAEKTRKLAEVLMLMGAEGYQVTYSTAYVKVAASTVVEMEQGPARNASAGAA